MKNLIIAIVMLTGMCTTRCLAQAVKPIRGTWLNLFYQDARNLYTNPTAVDMTSPELWRTKIQEMSDMGITYLVILAVANEGKAAYESDFMPRAYTAGQKSPVQAIMEAADEAGLKVFMSFGWAGNQDDDMRTATVRDLHVKIMRECASKFGGHPSFYGWYFPCEFSAAPNISDVAIQEVNLRAAEARRLTPNAKLMISPYTPSRAVVDATYVSQLAKLNVDIIAYQDGVGCVFVTVPAVKPVFEKLRWAHNQVPRIALWGNVETFTWEQAVNNRSSALVPAAFPRILSQMVGVSPYVDETISFIVQGMFDKPSSPRPVGQPVWSAKLGGHYLDFLAGNERWPLVAASFTGALAHVAIGKPVTLVAPPAARYSAGNLSDGKLGEEDFRGAQWLGFEKTNLEATIDLGASKVITGLAGRFLQYKPSGIELPSRVEFLVSEDGQTFKSVADIIPEKWGNDLHDYWIDMAVASNLKEQGRYVRVRAVNAGGWLFADELLVNPVGKGVEPTRNVLYVSNSGNDSYTGLSWGTAKATIQAAVDTVEINGTVLVSNGVYSTGSYVTPEAGSTLNNRVVITNNVLVRSLVPHGAVIQGPGAAAYNTGNARRCVFMNAGVLDGFVIEGGATAGGGFSWDTVGGGVGINSATAYATNCIIRNSKASFGGGVYYGELRDCIVSNNVAATGGGSYSSTLNRCKVLYNTQSGSGNAGGSYKGTAYSTLFAYNTGSSVGGTWMVDLYGCTVVSNKSSDNGPGIHYEPGYKIYNTLAFYNTGGTGKDIANLSTSSAVSNTLAGTSSMALPGITRISAGTRVFADPARGDYRLCGTSPAFNAGNTALNPALNTHDLALKARVCLGAVDAGAYELPEHMSVSFDVAPGVYVATVTPTRTVLIPSTNGVYGSYIPTDAAYRSTYEVAAWTSGPDGTGSVVTSDTPLLSLENHTVYVRWRHPATFMFLQ